MEKRPSFIIIALLLLHACFYQAPAYAQKADNTNTARTRTDEATQKRIEKLIEQLGDEGWIVRKLAAEALGQIGGPQVVQPLIKVLESDDEHPFVRLTAAEALGQIGEAQAVRPLIKALEVEHSNLRQSAACALGQTGDPQAVQPLIKALESKNRAVRMAAAEALGRTGGRQAVQPLIIALESDDGLPFVRLTAAEALGQIGDKRAIQPLIKASKDESPNVRQSAAKALRRVESRVISKEKLANLKKRVGVGAGVFILLGGLIAALAKCQKRKALTTPKTLLILAGLTTFFSIRPAVAQVRPTVAAAIAAQATADGATQKSVEKLIGQLGDKKASVRAAAAEALGDIGDARAVQPLANLLTDQSVIVRMFAAWALGDIGDPQAVQALINALSDESSGLGQAAAWALGEIGDKQAVQPLVSAFADRDPAIRRTAAQALGEIGDPQAVGLLIEALEDKDVGVRQSAARALGQIGDKQAVQALVKTLADPGEYARQAAAKALDNLSWQPQTEQEKITYLMAKRDWRELVTIGPPAIQSLINALEDEYSSVRLSAAEALDNLSWRPQTEQEKVSYLVATQNLDELVKIGPPAVQILTKALEEGRPLPPRAAAQALGEIGSPRAVLSLIKALVKEDWPVRKGAAKALLKIVQQNRWKCAAVAVLVFLLCGFVLVKLLRKKARKRTRPRVKHGAK